MRLIHPRVTPALRPPRARATLAARRSSTVPTTASDPPPLNPVLVPLISPVLRDQLFPSPSSPFSPARPSPASTALSQAHLAAHSLLPSSPPASLPPAIAFALPPLLGPTISHHFHHLGHFSSDAYKHLCSSFLADSPTLPPRPIQEAWAFTPGWTHYHPDGSFESVAYPDEPVLVFDVETAPFLSGDSSIMAVARGRKGWYGWVSPWLTGESESPEHLIPLGPQSVEEGGLREGKEAVKKLVIGHNVLFDRARVEGEYALRRGATRWLDTMSLHVAVSGLTSPQRKGWMKFRKERDLSELEDEETSIPSTPPPTDLSKPTPSEAEAKTWHQVSSLNSLAEVARLHCSLRPNKTPRSILLDHTTTLSTLQDAFSHLMDYCASDVEVTHAVAQAVWPKFLATCPHPASLAGVLVMGCPILPVDKGWKTYLASAEEAYRKRLEGVGEQLRTLAETVRKLPREEAENDVQLRRLDWSPKRARRLLPSSSVPPTPIVEGSPAPWVRKLETGDEDTKVLLLRTRWRSYPVVDFGKEGWAFAVPSLAVAARRGKDKTPRFVPAPGEIEVNFGMYVDETVLKETWRGHKLFWIPASSTGKAKKLLAKGGVMAKRIKEGVVDFDGRAEFLEGGQEALISVVERRKEEVLGTGTRDVWTRQLDWGAADAISTTNVDRGDLVWPKWYWDLDRPDGEGLDLTIKKRLTPYLLKLHWKGFPLVHSREHGWCYRIPVEDMDTALQADSSLHPLVFKDLEDHDLGEEADAGVAGFFQLPHPDGEGKNVGSPLSRPFLPASEDGTLTSVYEVARRALELNAECSYWAAARERIMGQMVVWPKPAENLGIILPQVTPMGTITRRAVEKTWLTASNAKKNRVGSELKAMVRAPPGYAIVGADVDSEELWICSVMGDAQFGIHGATAVGWMTLEGTKAAGTDLHSKTASILGISRDNAKVFNYSRIYGAGVKHAVQLLLKANPSLTKDRAEQLAKNLYAETKGVTYRGAAFDGQPFWHGGTESFVFNKLEAIARSTTPRTPAFGCGLTTALRKQYLPAEGRSKAGEGFMPSRINWVVQSSGVDYLHALLVAMEYLTDRFAIDARYMISVHDEIRYLVKEEDKYRAALALQIANLWTRTLFCYRLQMDDLPQSCAFFSAVDVDSCFRKEVNMTCVTPSNPNPIPFGESLDIAACLAATSNGSLSADGRSVTSFPPEHLPDLDLTETEIRGERHRVNDTAFLEAQTLKSSLGFMKLWRATKRLRSPPSSSAALNGTKAPYKPLAVHKSSPPVPEEFDDGDIPLEVESERYTVTRAATTRAFV